MQDSYRFYNLISHPCAHYHKFGVVLPSARQQLTTKTGNIQRGNIPAILLIVRVKTTSLPRGLSVAEFRQCEQK